MAYLEVVKEDNRLVIKTQYEKWEIEDEQENRKAFFIFLRSAVNNETGKPLYTFQEIADAFEYNDRRDINNYWREFQACGSNYRDYLDRKRKVDRRVVEAVEAELRKDVFVNLSDLCRRTNERLSRTDLTVPNMSAALEQIPCTVIRQGVLSNWDKEKFQPKEGYVLEAAMSALGNTGSSGKAAVGELICQLEIESKEEDLEDSIQDEQWDSVLNLLKPGFPVNEIPGKIVTMVFAMNLSFWNIPFSRIAQWFGICKGTAYNWVIGLALAIWLVIEPVLIEKIKGTRIYVDEKWLKIRKEWHYWFVGVDDETGLPILGALLATRTKWSCRWFMLKLKMMGKTPGVIITDGLLGYVSAIKKVFPKCKHLLCIFHYQQTVTHWVKKHLSDFPDKTLRLIKKKMKGVVQTIDTRTVKRRLKKLAQEDEQKKWGISDWIKNVKKKLDKLIPALRDNNYPKTTNRIERFFRTFNRFYKTRCGFHSVESAKRELILFLVVYIFTIQPESGKAPIEAIIPRAREMPLYQLLNYPLKFGMKSVSYVYANFKGLENTSQKPLKEAA
jgi:transposase-like protein